MKKKIIVFFLLAVLAFDMAAPVNTVFADVPTTFDILSGSSVVRKGESFTVIVAAKNIRDMYACEVRLTFDDSLLKYEGITSDIQWYKYSTPVDTKENKIIFTAAKSGNQSPKNGDVQLCTMRFTGKEEGNARVTMDTVKLMDEILRETDYSVGKALEISIGAAAPPTPTIPPATPAPSVTPITTPVARITIKPNLVQLDAATGIARVNLGEQAAGIFSGKDVSVINVPPVPGAIAYTLSIPADSLSGTLGGGLLSFSTGIGSITIPGNMLAEIPEAGGKEIDITIGSGVKSDLSDDLKEAIGDRPLVQLNLTLDGMQTRWDNPNAPVTISIPYTPTAEELADPEHIVVWYINGEGKAVPVPNGRYDTANGTVTFTVTHFSYYAVAYVHKVFGDLGSVEWARKSIEVLASKGIINGTGGDKYSPTLNITRADYLLLLVRTFELRAEVKGNFDDVKPDTYYYEAVGIAKKLGITQGVGNNHFLPREPITRQDMMVMTAKAAKIAGKLDSTGDSTVLDSFIDKTQIASYATRSIAALVEAGLITGSNNRILPLANTTRAEAAVLMYRIYNMVISLGRVTSQAYTILG